MAPPLALLLLPLSLSFPSPRRPLLFPTASRASSSSRSASAALSLSSLPPEDSPDEADTSLTRDLAQELETREFTSDLYAHLQKRPDYETSALYKSLRSRVDVPDPIYSDLEKVKDRDMAVPTVGQTPTEIIDLVLIELREDRSSSDNPAAGVETLMRFSGPGSSIHMGGKVTPPMLLDYFRESKYKVLLQWVSIAYPKKLELSLDKTKALQQTKLKTPSGDWVPVTFQFTKHDITGGPIWLIDQVLVKSSVEDDD